MVMLIAVIQHIETGCHCITTAVIMLLPGGSQMKALSSQDDE